MNGPPDIPYELFIDLRETEGTSLASLSVIRIDPQVPPSSEPESGLLLSADRGSHGADLHLTWAQVRELRDTLSRLLSEAGED